MNCSRDDVVLLPITFADLSSRKVRPAVVVGRGSFPGDGIKLKRFYAVGLSFEKRNTDALDVINQRVMSDLVENQEVDPVRERPVFKLVCDLGKDAVVQLGADEREVYIRPGTEIPFRARTVKDCFFDSEGPGEHPLDLCKSLITEAVFH